MALIIWYLLFFYLYDGYILVTISLIYPFLIEKKKSEWMHLNQVLKLGLKPKNSARKCL